MTEITEAKPIRIVPGSWFHRWLNVKPGSMSNWIMVRDGCIGPDLFMIGFVVMMWSPLIFAAWIGMWAMGLMFIGVVAWAMVLGKPYDRERWGRARKRRGECVWCGMENTSPGIICQQCGLQN